MSEPERDRRRPLPALVFILALTVLTALVWWRVLHRGGGDASGAATSNSACPTATPPTATGSAPAATGSAPTPPRPRRPHTLPPPRTVRVHVLNATNRTGLAGRTTTALHKDGFRTTAPGNDESGYRGKGVGEIRYGAEAKPAAQLVNYFLPSAKLVPVHTRSATVTLALGRKFHGLQPRHKVIKHLRHNHIRLSSSAAPRSLPAHPTPTC